jgi:hypothetical protein
MLITDKGLNGVMKARNRDLCFIESESKGIAIPVLAKITKRKSRPVGAVFTATELSDYRSSVWDMKRLNAVFIEFRGQRQERGYDCTSIADLQAVRFSNIAPIPVHFCPETAADFRRNVNLASITDAALTQSEYIFHFDQENEITALF